jgi:hypothetical protein
MTVASIKYFEKNMKQCFISAYYGDLTIIHTSKERAWFLLFVGCYRNACCKNQSLLDDILKNELAQHSIAQFPLIKSTRRLRLNLKQGFAMADEFGCVYVRRSNFYVYAIISSSVLSKHEQQVRVLQQRVRALKPLIKAINNGSA